MKTKKINWIASYPKSGNTFVRILLENYLSGRDEPVDLNAMHLVKGDMSGNEVLASGAVEAGLSFEEGMRRRLSVHRQFVDEGRARVFVKTHLPNLALGGAPLIAPDLTRRAIYIFRDPRDVCVSFADHSGRTVEAMADLMTNHEFAHDGRPATPVDFIGSWQQHVASWMMQPAFPVLPVAYERLVAETRTVLIEMIRFLDLKLDAGRCSFAVAASSFRRLQEQESRSGFHELSPSSTSGRFFRRGVSGNWSSALSAELAGRVAAQAMPLARLLGYC